MTSAIHVHFSRGTLCLDGDRALVGDLPEVLWDERIAGFRAPAHAAGALVAAARARGSALEPIPWPDVPLTAPFTEPELRPYQRDALGAWESLGRRGLVVLPTGAGKTRLAIAALSRARRPALVLVPVRTLLDQWARELSRWYAGPVGIVGDGERRVEDVTVMTFESAYRRLDVLGDRFVALVVDEAHHFGGGSRTEALEMCTAPIRLGLTATPPPAESASAVRLEALIGPTACEVSLGALLGGPLADFDLVRLFVRLSAPEQGAYARGHGPFAELRAAFARAHPEADWAALVRALARSATGRAALSGFQRAAALAAFPEAKRALTKALLARHRGDRVLVFTAAADDAVQVSLDNLVPVITADTSRREREAILQGFRDGRLSVIVSARVLNEGIDVPDARVAILIGGTLGTRELVQRIGRVLRPAPGKRAVIYELVTAATVDARRADTRRRGLAAGRAADP